MIKAILFLFNLLGIYLCGLLFPSSVSLSQTAPSSAEINNSVLVQVTINKGDLNGMGKFAEQLPAGFTAVAIDDEGAQTSFDSNTIVFSWSSLPSDAILNISFRVDITSSAAIQNDVLTGRFFYTTNGQSSETDCTPSNITIRNGSASQSSSASQGTMPQNSIVPQDNSLPQNTTISQGNSSPQVQNPNTPSGRVFVVRQFSSTTVTPKTGTKVIFTIHKNGITGFAKIEDSIPPGFTASQGDLNGASFTFIDNRAKFVWDNLPSDSVFTVSYLISANSNVPGTHVVVGNFSYIDNTNNPSLITIESSIFNSSILPGYDIAAERGKNPPPPASSNANNTVSTETVNTSSPANPSQNSSPPVANPSDNTTAPQTASTSPVTNTPQNSTPPPASNPSDNTASANVTPTNTVSTTNNQPAEAANVNATSSPQPEAIPPAPTTAASGITYKVQIMALRNPVPVSYFVSRKKIKEHINTEVEEGLTKYTIGNYTDYKSVKDEKDNLKNQGFEGAFVVCYKSGMRITLQEALKISHQ